MQALEKWMKSIENAAATWIKELAGRFKYLQANSVKN
jgi:hypothetical protein